MLKSRVLMAMGVCMATLLVGAIAGAPTAVAADSKASVRYYLPSAPETSSAENDSLGTSLLDPGTIGLCNAGFGDVSVKSWDDTVLGYVDLFCGDSASGYIHIRDGDGSLNDVGHEADWQDVVDSFGGGLWDDFMLYATGEAIVDDKAPDDHGNDKLCFTTSIDIYKSDGTYITTYQPTVIVSANNKSVITSYPTHYQSDC
ncbi:hypothetical protein [Rathayibacter tanaceti]|uniref:Secreted protein n=2 Tax=Rathayibacter tanaceti TaxID=1671680 RepID=A0A162GJ11_9MICO|nr:hypothetical protein [Rathayibacter tanaceti]KZX21969.1 hypothetical protein ACH61_00888 [Rathayibacter tanaceti]QHC56785.1 hypothetical protein GSU10_14870 [Rathayibacter tanaceti]TCO33757.1 hypothetical protein EV639_11440 [Rathayibacter tanaceti]